MASTTTHNLLVSMQGSRIATFSTACLAPPRCFSVPINDQDVIVGTSYEDALTKMQTVGSSRVWYQLDMDDATGFFGDAACASERCPGSVMAGRICTRGGTCLSTGTTFSTNTWACPLGTVKYTSVSNPGVTITFTVEDNVEFLTPAPESCVDVGNERRCEAGSYEWLTTLKQDVNPEKYCSGTSVQNIQCADSNDLSGENLRGACPGYTCVSGGDEVGRALLEMPEFVVQQWTTNISASGESGPVPPPTPDPTPAPTPAPSFTICFPGDAFAIVEGQGKTKMENLKIGDRVLTGQGFEPIYSFGHRNADTKATFLKLVSTKDPNMFVELSADHLVFTKMTSGPVPASYIKPGDELQMGEPGQYMTVKTISSVLKKGVYAPFTPSGSIILNDGVKTSCFVTLQPNVGTLHLPSLFNDNKNSDPGFWDTGLSYHSLAHKFESAHRVYCHYLDCSQEKYDDDGISQWVKMPHTYFRWALGSQLNMALVLPPVAATVVVSSPHFWTLLVLVVFSWCATRRGRHHKLISGMRK